MERACVGQQSGVNVTGDFGSDLRADGLGEVGNHLADGGGGRIYPVEVAEEIGRRVMVDVDDELVFEARQPGTRNVAAFDDEDRVVFAVDVGRHADLVGAWQARVGVRHVIAHNHFGVFV